MKLTIETAQNGFILRASDGDDESAGYPIVIANDNRVEATRALLYEVLDAVGPVGSRYDEWRVQVVLEHGDKWIDPTGPEAEAIRLGKWGRPLGMLVDAPVAYDSIPSDE